MTDPPGGTRTPIALRCFPRADRAFQRTVEGLIAADPTLDPRDPDSAARLQRQLQRRYPGASVRLQDPLATFGAATPPVWYIHRRDEPAGDPPGGTPAADGDAAPDDGTAGVPASGPGSRPVYSAAAAAAMVGVPLASVVGWDAEGLVTPSVTREGQRLYSRNDLDDLVLVKREVTAGHSSADARAALEDRRSRRRDRFGGPAGTRRLLVLLAERDPYAAEYAEYFLRTEGYDVEVAFDVAEAHATAESIQPDIAVVELLISGGSGAELCARLKAGGTSAVLAISSLDDEDVALRAGADAFLAKPLDPLEFVSTIKDLLGESAMLQLGSAR